MTPFRPPPPTKSARPLQLVGRWVSKLSCGAIVPSTRQYSGKRAVPATKVVERISAPPMVRPARTSHATSGFTGVCVEVAPGLAVWLVIEVGLAAGVLIAVAVSVARRVGVWEGLGADGTAVPVGVRSGGGASPSEHDATKSAQAIRIPIERRLTRLLPRRGAGPLLDRSTTPIGYG